MNNDQSRTQPLTRAQFKARVHTWATKLGVEVNAISIRPMTNKWASCSTNGNLSFNDELLGLDPELGDYVIVHELLHFSVPNHGRLWKSLMRAHLGEYENFESRLAVEATKARMPKTPSNRNILPSPQRERGRG